jgi:plastocyanin
MRAVLLLAGLAALAGCVHHEATAPVKTDHVEIPGPWVFEPAAIEVVAGTSVTITNQGGAHHGVTLDALGIDVDLAPGESTTIAFDEPGEYEYWCKFHRPT